MSLCLINDRLARTGFRTSVGTTNFHLKFGGEHKKREQELTLSLVADVLNECMVGKLHEFAKTETCDTQHLVETRTHVHMHAMNTHTTDAHTRTHAHKHAHKHTQMAALLE